MQETYNNEKKVPNMIKAIKYPTYNAFENFLKRKKMLSMKEAADEVSKLYIRKFDKETNTVIEYPLNIEIEEFQKFGEGLYFYLYFAKFFTIIFFIIAVGSIGLLAINLQGSGLSHASQINIFLSSTIGNISSVEFNQEEIDQLDQMTESEKEAFLSGKFKATNTYFYIYMIIDMIFCIIFFISYLMFKANVNLQTRIMETRNISVNKYTIMVKGFGTNKPDKSIIKELFRPFGKIVSINYGYKLEKNINRLMNLAETFEKCENIKNESLDESSENKVYQKLEKQLKAICKSLNVEKIDFLDNTEFNVYCAFVIFNEVRTQSIVLREFKQAYTQPLKNKLLCKNKIIPEKYLYKGRRKLDISVPDHPSNIIWPNLGYSLFKRNIKVGIVILIGLLLIVLSFLVNLYLVAIADNTRLTSCESNVMEYEELDETHPEYESQKYCFCQSLAINVMLSDENYRSLCYPIYLQELKRMGVTLSIGVSISIFNLLIQIIIFKLTEWIQYTSKTEVITKKIFFTFIIQYINVAFVVYIMYGRFLNFSLLEFINTAIGAHYFKIDNYIIGLNREWYTFVAPRIIMPMIIAVFNPNVLQLLLHVLIRYLRKRKTKKVKTANEYIKINTPSEFILEAKYSYILKCIFVCFTFSTGIPLLNILLFLFLFVNYWINKYIIVRYSRKPSIYSSLIIKNIVSILPYVLIFHCVFGIYIITSRTIFPLSYKEYIDSDNPQEDYITMTSIISNALFRFNKALPYTLMTGFMIGIIVFEKSIAQFYKFIRPKKIENKSNLNMNNYITNYEKIKYFSLPNYNINANPKYQKLLALKTVENLIPDIVVKQPNIIRYIKVPNDNRKARKSEYKRIEEKLLKEVNIKNQDDDDNSVVLVDDNDL